MLKVRIDEKTFGEKEVFKDLSLEFKDAGVYAVTGVSGRGKTTLLNIIAGLDTDFKGEVNATGKMSYVFQEDRLVPGLSALENVMLVCKDEGKAKELLEKVGLGEELKSKPGTLSGGMKRRIAIARALAFDFDILLLDEPFSSVDEERKKSLMDLIANIAKDKLVILVTHDKEEAEYLGAEIINVF